MTELITTDNVVFVIGVLGVIFSVFLYFRNPQVKAEKNDALIEQKIKLTKEADEQRLKLIQESNDRRFADMHDEIKSVLATSQNHIHTVDTKVDHLTANVVKMGQEIVRLGTIIEERIPKK